MVLQNLELETACDGEAKVDLLEVLLGYGEGFLCGKGVGAELLVNGVDGVLEVFTFFKTQKRNGRLQKDGNPGIVVLHHVVTGGERACGQEKAQNTAYLFYPAAHSQS
jgi:hypothetical protein